MRLLEGGPRGARLGVAEAARDVLVMIAGTSRLLEQAACWDKPPEWLVERTLYPVVEIWMS